MMSQPDGVSNVSKRPPPTPQAIEEARQYCSQLYHAWTERPPTDSPLRRSWDLLFMQACKALGKVLKNYKFKSLPPFIIGCIWEFNNHVYDRTPFVDVEAIRDANDSSHPALNPASARYLRYQPAIDGPVVIQPRTDVRDVWWEADGTCIDYTLSAEFAYVTHPLTSNISLRYDQHRRRSSDEHCQSRHDNRRRANSPVSPR